LEGDVAGEAIEQGQDAEDRPAEQVQGIPRSYETAPPPRTTVGS